MAITWQTNPSYSNYANEPSADLDLRIRDPFGTQVAISNSFDNTYELVDLTPALSGWYTLRVNRPRCAGSPRAFGWAWYQ